MYFAASRRKAEEIIFITPDAQLVAESVQRCVDELILLDTTLGQSVKDEKKVRDLYHLSDFFVSYNVVYRRCQHCLKNTCKPQ